MLFFERSGGLVVCPGVSPLPHRLLRALGRSSWRASCARPLQAMWRGVLGLSLCLSAACIVPVAPEFEPPEPNLSPYVVSASPPIGGLVGDQDLEVVLADPNPGDTLSLRWVFNYPPFSASASRVFVGELLPPPEGGGQVRARVARIRPTCFRDLVPGLARHRAMLVVSDRGFAEPTSSEFPFDAVPVDAHVLRVTWVVEKDCR